MKVPEALRTAGIIKKREFRKSLGTANLAEARRLLHMESIRIDAEIAAGWRKLESTPVATLSRSDLDYLALQWFHESENKRVITSPTGESELSREESEHDHLYWEAVLADPNHPDCSVTVHGTVQQIFLKQGISIDPAAREFAHLFELIRRGMLEQERRRLRAFRQDFSRGVGDELFEHVHGDRPLQRVARVTLSELINKQTTEPSRLALSPKSKIKAAGQARLFKEVIGAEKLISDITRDDAAALVDVLTKLPANASKRFPGLPARDVVDIAVTKRLAPMSRISAKSYLSAFSSLMEFAISRGFRTDNPAQRLSVGSDRISAKDRRHPFNTEQLNKIFSAPLYTGCKDDQQGYAKRGPNIIRRGRFWVPLISLFSGMRMQEICQLEVSDIAILDGVDVIIVQDDDAGVKRIKSAAGRRYVPIHPELKQIGFLEYHRLMREGGERRLFPELTASEASGYLSDNFSKWFANFLRSAGAKRPRTSFHSFRHSYRDALREANISPERVRALGGWSSGRTEDDYGSGLRASTLANEIEKVQYPGLNLGHLHVPFPSAR
ncbi:tyrosine-type recombinase/integrase [Microvirga makkahensis]|uniref:Tyrosine-type recombinase/integrase n=1 Tax=Microvirga makkahensis TaxID=1128670 RepID=A0A7X3SN97_9HYPH|nr:tyrosine-type recombinase/integrase [Microvirga makkahensis]